VPSSAAPRNLVHLKWESSGTLSRGGLHAEATGRRRSHAVAPRFDRDLARGLTIPDICRKVGIAETTDYRWRERHDPVRVDADRRCRELGPEVGRLKRLVAELMLDEQMLQDLAIKEW
jgi:putative transposase